MARNPWRDLLLLTALCWATYCVGLTTHGLTNWQEAQRTLVAREMQARGEWIVPTVDGRPYLAKPPMVYWWQLALADARGAVAGEFELRLTVALAGWLGVLGTYVLARRLEGGIALPGDAHRGEARCHDRGEVAWWSSLFLATGILYVRSSRVGELDVLLVPFTVAAVAGVHAAWRSHLDRGRTHFVAVGVAVAAAVGAMLTKGPPGILAILLAGYGAVALFHAREAAAPRRLAAATGAVALPVACVLLSWPASPDAEDFLGIVLYAAMGLAIGWTVGGLLRPRNARATIVAYSRTHPVAVIGLPFLALWAWGKFVAARIGPDALALAVRTETADNFRALVPGSPVNNLEASLFGVGLGSFAAVGAAVWLVRRRVPRSPELCVLVAWVVGGLIAFSVLGKGVGRYLTPLWPGIALLGGLWWTVTLPKLRRPRLARVAALVLVLGLGLGQSVWYAWGRERLYPDRSPRAMMAELLGKPGVDAKRLAMFEFETPAVDFYAGRRIESIQTADPKPWLTGTTPRSLAQLRDSLAPGSAYTLLIRDDPAALEELRGAGLSIAEIPLGSRFTIENRRTNVRAVRVSLSGASASPPAPPAASGPPG